MQEPELPVAAGVGSDRLRSAVLHQLPWYVVAMIGPEHRFMAVNEELLRVFGGFNPVGMRAVDFLGGIEGQGVIDIYDRAYAGERALLHRMRYVVAMPEGHQQELVIDFEMSPFRNERGEIIGVIGAGRDVSAQLAQEEADAAAAAELNQRYRRATDVVEEVQRALLPARLPVLPALDVAASYVVGGVEQAAGGDWFDVLALDDRTVAAVVGDVVGHGVAASAVMAQVRAVALERLHAGADVAEVVSALDRFVEVVPGAAGSTICVLTVDVPSGGLRYCSAGHPPPLLAGDDGAFLAPSGEGPLGSGGDRRVLTGELGQQVLLLYSDGIVERPGVPATRGVVELTRTATAAVADELLPAFSSPSAVDRATGQVLERLTRETGASDDITLLALQRVPALGPFHLDRVVGRTDVGEVRASLRAWFRPGQVDERALFDLDQIVTELVENAVEHAYDGADGRVTVRAELSAGGDLELTVGDRGSWRPPSSVRGRGVGLALVQQLSTALTIDHEHGTRVTVRHRPWKPSRSTVPRSPAPQPLVADVFLMERAGGHVLRARGAIDAALLGELESNLALCTTPGAGDLVIDLDDVTVLSSSAIKAIRDGLARAQSGGVRAQVRSRLGSVAQQVLALAGIPTATDTTG